MTTEEMLKVQTMHEELMDQIRVLRAALERLVNDSMYKDHPEASQMAIDALGKQQQPPQQGFVP